VTGVLTRTKSTAP